MDTIKEKILSELWNTLGTAWSEFTDDEKAQFEKGWGVAYEVFDQLLIDVLQRTGNFSFITAPPFFIASGIVNTLMSTTPAALELLGIVKAPDTQYSEHYIIYTSGLRPLNGENTFYYEGVDFTNLYEINREDTPSINDIYLLLNEGFVLLDGTNPLWQDDNFISGLDLDSDQFDPYV